MDFPCSGCGACCLNVKHIPDLAPWADESGRCSKLGSDDKTCTIYADRPLVCDIGGIGKHLRLTREAWYFLNRRGCEYLHQLVHAEPIEPAGSVCQHGKPTLPRTPTAPRHEPFPSLLDRSPGDSLPRPPEE